MSSYLQWPVTGTPERISTSLLSTWTTILTLFEDHVTLDGAKVSGQVPCHSSIIDLGICHWKNEGQEALNMMGCEQIEDDIIDCRVAIIATFTPATAQLRLWVPRLFTSAPQWRQV